MPNLKLLTTDEALAATIVASTTAGGLVANNVKTNEPTEIWRATSTTATLTLTLSGSKQVDCVVLGWTNIATTATVTVDLYTLSGDSTPVRTVTASLGSPVSGLANNIQVWPTLTTCQKVRISVSGNSANVEIGKVMLGKSFSLGLDPQQGTNLTLVDPSSQVRSESGAVRVDRKKPYRKLTLSYSSLPQSDVLTLLGLALQAPRVVFVSLYSEDVSYSKTHAFIGALTPGVQFGSLSIKRASTSLEISEVC